MKNKKIIRTFAATLAVMLCFAAFSTTAFAGGADPDPAPLPEDPAPLPEETGTPTTGGIELDTEDGEGGSHTSGTTETSEDAENTGDKETSGAAETMTDEEMAALLSSLLGSQVDVTVTDEGIPVPARGQTTKPLPSFPTGRRWK